MQNEWNPLLKRIRCRRWNQRKFPIVLLSLFKKGFSPEIFPSSPGSAKESCS
jgi:hypothetical protein